MVTGQDHRVDAGMAGIDEPMRERLLSQFRAALDALVEAWFPRVIDTEYGGYLCDFDRRWRATRPHLKLQEFQARQSRFAAEAAGFYRDREDLRAAADHGISYLCDVMWDREHGGFYRILDRAGSPLEEGAKHSHGTAYALLALTAHHRLTGSDASLDMAKRVFGWLERCAHDGPNGGYFGFHARDGRPIMDRRHSLPQYAVRDPIATPLGLKDVNTTKDMLDGLGQLSTVWPDSLVMERVREVLDITCTHVVVPPGTAHVYSQPDWTPVPDCAHYGHNVHLASVLLHAADSLTREAREKAAATSRALMDCALAYAWTPDTGGFALAGPTYGRCMIEDEVFFFSRKEWWPQAEALVALVELAGLWPGAGYARHADRLWRYMRKHLIDERHGGWYRTGMDAGRRYARLPKADMWRDASHEGMCLIRCIRLLESGN
jgi:mannobiose 2-epimerase